jgi:diguanylate cyclase (GGDEF)-like protein
MSAQIDRPAAPSPGGATVAPAVVPATPPGHASGAERARARARAIVWRSGLLRALEPIKDAWLVGGIVLMGIGGAAWIIDHIQYPQFDLTLDMPLAIAGAMFIAWRLGARRVHIKTGHLAVLQAASARMSRAPSVEAVGRAIVEETGRILDYHNARVYTLEPPDQLVPIAFEGRVGAYDDVDLELLRTTVGQGFTGWVALHGVPLLIDDANTDPRGQTIPGTEDVDESMLVVPMRYDDRVVGVITLSKLGLHQFRPDDLRLLTILADQAATALETARLVTHTSGLAAELRSLLDMSSSLSKSLDPRQVGELMARHLAEAVGADECGISTWDRAGDRVLTIGYYPVESPENIQNTFGLGEYPETRRVLETKAEVVVQVDDPAADPHERAHPVRHGQRTMIMLPLVAKDESIGLVELYGTERLDLEGPKLGLVRTMANEAAIALENAILYERARDLADRDPLTGFFNHRYFHERLGEELLRAGRTHAPVSVLMLDVDEFKAVNDTLGHIVGDRVLTWVADVVRSTLRASDVPARYGGDEFALILPDTDALAAARVGERIVGAFADRAFQPEGRGPVPIGVSIGVATCPDDGLTATALIATADAGLYGVKRTGGHGIERPAATARRGRGTGDRDRVVAPATGPA